MAKPIISLIAPAIRTHLWLDVYDSLKSNKVPLEIVFVGDRKPSVKLPNNFKYIYSNVKPVQCMEIACRASQGELVANISDDAFFWEKTIDNLYKVYEKVNEEKAIVSFRWLKYGKLVSKNLYYYFIGDKSSPMLPLGGLLKRALWKNLGGLDNRFIATCADADLYLRVFEAGGSVYYSENSIFEERKEISGKKNLYPAYGKTFDRPLLDSFWVKNNKVSKHRLLKFEPFASKNIESTSQGNVGEWNNSLLRKIRRNIVKVF